MVTVVYYEQQFYEESTKQIALQYYSAFENVHCPANATFFVWNATDKNSLKNLIPTEKIH